MKFEYKCGTPSGDIVEDIIEAVNENDAKEKLESKGLYVFFVKKQKKSFELNFNKKKEIIPFTKMFHVLLKSGMEIINILEVLAEQIENPAFKASVQAVIRDVRSGNSLADSMKKQNTYFTDFYCTAVEAGEKTGALVETFDRLHKYIKSQEKIKAKIRLAAIYPVFLISFAVVVVLFLSLYVLPSFAKIYNSFGKQIPGITKLVLDTSMFIRSFWFLILGAIFASLWGLKKYSEDASRKYNLDKIILKLPNVGEFIHKKENTTMFRTLALSISSGMDILKSLEIAQNTFENLVLKEKFKNVIIKVSQGERLSTSLKEAEVPKMAAYMISAGEESNNLEEMLDSVSEFYEEEMENGVAALIGFIEPLLILFVGGIIGFIIVAMLLPILTLSTAVG